MSLLPEIRCPKCNKLIARGIIIGHIEGACKHLFEVKKGNIAVIATKVRELETSNPTHRRV